MVYRQNYRPPGPAKKRQKNTAVVMLAIFSACLVGFGAIKLLSSENSTLEETIQNKVEFTEFVSDDEKTLLNEAIADQNIQLADPVTVSVELVQKQADLTKTLNAYVPVTAFGSTRQSITTEELAAIDYTYSDSVNSAVSDSINTQISSDMAMSTISENGLEYEAVAIVPVAELDANYQLLSLDDHYYLDSFTDGAFFRTVNIDGDGVEAFSNFSLDTALQSEDTYKVNLTGVTALTREMQRKLIATGNDPLYFSALIGDFLADADTTHISNEVSFVEDCPYSYTLFCSPPEFIETLKASGVDIVELTGNHNNDLGASHNTSTIELYESLGWETIGGGLNAADAAEPYIADVKDSSVAFLAYNYPDSPNGEAIAGAESAGANPFDFSYNSIESDIIAAKEKSEFVIVNVQYWECYSYPDGYLEFPECDKPIGEQEATFKQLIDLGADMVVGSSAHQPQTYELYKDKPIYYGLGNLYFEQTSWPGTERGIVLTNYFVAGKLLQTKLTPTVYDRDLQTRIMTPEESAYLLGRLKQARN